MDLGCFSGWKGLSSKNYIWNSSADKKIPQEINHIGAMGEKWPSSSEYGYQMIFVISSKNMSIQQYDDIMRTSFSRKSPVVRLFI